MIERDIPLAQGQQLTLPCLGNRAFLGQEWPRPELKSNRTEFGIADPIAPFAQIPHPTRHKDRRLGEPEIDHQAAQLANARVGGLGPLRVLAVGDPVMAPRQPRVFVDDPAEPVAEFVIGPFPQCPESPARRHDRVIMHSVTRTDLGDPVGHAGAARDAVDETLGPFQHTVEHAFGRRHFPQYVHVDAALAVGTLVGHPRLLNTAGDRVGDEFLVPFHPRPPAIDLRDRLSSFGAAVGVDTRKCPDPSGSGPCSRAFAI